MLAPLTSLIVPVMVPVNDCAKRIDGHNAKTTQSAVRIRRMAVPPRRRDYRPGRPRRRDTRAPGRHRGPRMGVRHGSVTGQTPGWFVAARNASPIQLAFSSVDEDVGVSAPWTGCRRTDGMIPPR